MTGTIFTGGTILTVDDADPAAEVIGIVGDKIVAVSSFHEVKTALPAGDGVVDLEGQNLLSGFIEAHPEIWRIRRRAQPSIAPPVPSAGSAAVRVLLEPPTRARSRTPSLRTATFVPL